MKRTSPMRIRSNDERLFNILIYTLAAVLLILVIYPLIFVLSASFSNPVQVIEGKVWLLPQGFTLDPYYRVIENESIWKGYANTIIYTVAGTLVNIVFTI